MSGHCEHVCECEWGYMLGSGVVDRWCDRCGARMEPMPLDDFKAQADVLALARLEWLEEQA